MFVWVFASVLAFFIKGLCGFANTLIFTSILSFRVDNVLISPVELLLGSRTNMIIAGKERKAISWRLCLPVAALVLAGSVLGVIFLKNVNADLVKLLFGLVIVCLCMEMLLENRHPSKREKSRLASTLIGLLSGFLCGLYGVGALAGIYMGRVTEDTHSFKANLCVVFLLENVFRFAIYIAYGIITWEAVTRALTLLPVMLISLFAGMKLSGRINEAGVRRLVTVMLVASGLALMIKSGLNLI